MAAGDSISAVAPHGQCLSQTSSRCVTGSATASHNFEVSNYPLLAGMGIGRFVSSSTFSVGGCDWRIDFYPDGKETENQGAYASAFLKFVRGTASAVGGVILSFSLLGDNRDQVTNQRTLTRRFESVGDEWGFSRLIEKSNLWTLLQRLNGGCFTIRCVLTVKEVPRTEDDDGDAAAAAAAIVVVPPPKLRHDLTDMLRSGEGADVVFSVGSRLFPAHRCILAARSVVFKAELFGATKEKDEQRIEIHDMEPAVFEALLHYVYADSLPDDNAADDNTDSNEATQHLLAAADRYGLDRLRLLCEAKLCCGIDAQTVVAILALAEQHRCTQLKGACIGFIASRDVLGDVMKADGFKRLTTSRPSIMEDILDKVSAVWSSK